MKYFFIALWKDIQVLLFIMAVISAIIISIISPIMLFENYFEIMTILFIAAYLAWYFSHVLATAKELKEVAELKEQKRMRKIEKLLTRDTIDNFDNFENNDDDASQFPFGHPRAKRN